MYSYVAIAVGGTLGCWARFGMTNLVQAIYGRSFPYATLSINVLGSFLMGFLFIETLERLAVSPVLRTGILTGFLGGFTTFSTFSLDAALLIERHSWGVAAGYVVGSVAAAIAALFFGLAVFRSAGQLP